MGTDRPDLLARVLPSTWCPYHPMRDWRLTPSVGTSSRRSRWGMDELLELSNCVPQITCVQPFSPCTSVRYWSSACLACTPLLQDAQPRPGRPGPGTTGHAGCLRHTGGRGAGRGGLTVTIRSAGSSGAWRCLRSALLLLSVLRVLSYYPCFYLYSPTYLLLPL